MKKKSAYKIIWLVAILGYVLGASLNALFLDFSTEGQLQNSVGEAIMSIVVKLQVLEKNILLLQMVLLVVAIGVAYVLHILLKKLQAKLGDKFIPESSCMIGAHIFTYGLISKCTLPLCCLCCRR